MSKTTLDSFFQGKIGTIWCRTLEQFRAKFTPSELEGSRETAQVKLEKSGSKVKIIAEISNIVNETDKSFLEFIIPEVKDKDQRLEKYFECRELKRFPCELVFDRLLLKCEKPHKNGKKHEIENSLNVTFTEDFFNGLKPNISNLLLQINPKGFEYFAIAKTPNEATGCAFEGIPIDVIGIIFSYVDYVDLS
jgi:hypothetical protein